MQIVDLQQLAYDFVCIRSQQTNIEAVLIDKAEPRLCVVITVHIGADMAAPGGW